MRSVGNGITDAMNDGDLALIVERFHRTHTGVESIALVEWDDLVVGNPNVGSGIFVETVLVRDDAVEVVVSSRELDDYEGFFSGFR